MLKKAFGYLLLILGVWLAINLLLLPVLEPQMIYFPMKEIESTPGKVGIKYEEVWLRTEDGTKINGWFVPNKNSRKVILFFHGNGGNISHRLDKIGFFCALPANVFIIDYHGYGRSEGSPSEENLYRDAEAAYQYLISEKKFSPQQIVVYGSSLGGVVAVDLAVKEEIGALILQSTFTSAKDMAVRMNPLYRRPITWIRSDFDALGKIGKIKAPLLIIHSKQDEMIPYRMSLALFERASEPKGLLLLERGGHNDFIVTPEYLKSLRDIISNND